MPEEVVAAVPDVAEVAAPPATATEEPAGAMKSALSQALDKYREGGLEAFRGEQDTDKGADAAVESEPAEEGAAEGETPADSSSDEAPSTDEDAGAEEGESEEESGTVEEEEAPAEEEEDSAALTVELPGRQDGETITVSVATEEEANAIRRMANDGMRRQEFNRQMGPVRRDKEEVDAFVQRLREDAPGLVLERATPETKRALVREILLTDEAIRSEVAREVYEFESDPSTLARATAEMERDRARREADNLRNETVRNADMSAASAILRTVEALVPEGTDELVADEFFRDAAEYLQVQAFHHGSRLVNPKNVSRLLESRLRLYGLTPDAAADAPVSTSTKPTMKATATPARAPAPDIENAKKAGEKLTKRAAKAKAAVVAPPGAGAKPATVKPPPGQNVKERIAWWRKNRIA